MENIEISVHSRKHLESLLRSLGEADFSNLSDEELVDEFLSEFPRDAISNARFAQTEVGQMSEIDLPKHFDSALDYVRLLCRSTSWGYAYWNLSNATLSSHKGCKFVLRLNQYKKPQDATPFDHVDIEINAEDGMLIINFPSSPAVYSVDIVQVWGENEQTVASSRKSRLRSRWIDKSDPKGKDRELLLMPFTLKGHSVVEAHSIKTMIEDGAEE